MRFTTGLSECAGVGTRARTACVNLRFPYANSQGKVTSRAGSAVKRWCVYLRIGANASLMLLDHGRRAMVAQCRIWLHRWVSTAGGLAN